MHYILNKNGIPAIIMKEYNPEDDSMNDLWIVIWNSIVRLPKRCIVFNLDPLVSHVSEMFHNLVAKSSGSQIIKFIDYCYGDNEKAIADLNLPYCVVPYGYSPYYEYLYSKFNISGEAGVVDILFYGNINGRRLDVIKKVAQFCRDKGYTMSICNNSLYDDFQKMMAIHKSKIVLSVASSDAMIIKTNDLARLSQIISIGGFAITEYIGDATVEGKMSEYVPHYKSDDELLELLDNYLMNANEMVKMKELAREKFKLDFNFERDFISALDIENMGCYANSRSVLLLSSETILPTNADVEMVSFLLKGFRDNNMKIYTNIELETLTDNDEIIEDKHDIIEAGRFVHFIILISSELDKKNGLWGAHKYIKDINRKNITSYINIDDDEYGDICRWKFDLDLPNQTISQPELGITICTDSPKKVIDYICQINKRQL
jgi:hypothetical protein